MGKRYRKMTKNANGKMEIQDEKVILELPLPVAEVLAGIPEAVDPQKFSEFLEGEWRAL